MAVEKHTLAHTFVAGADMSAETNLYKFVKLDGAGAVVVCSAATDKPIGTLQNLPKLGQAAAVCVEGISKVRADANLAPGNAIGTSADGEADAKIPGTDTTEFVCGTVLEDNSAAGEYLTCAISCSNPHRAA